ncbi:MAG: tyrosine-type recombinase/integrase [Dehalococcoidia bacterium]
MSYKDPASLLKRTVASGEYQQLAQSFRRSLLAENKAPRTVETYAEAIRSFGDFLAQQGMPTVPRHIKREHVEAYIADLLSRWKPATASNRYRALQQYFKWMVMEGEIKTSPMQNTKPPIIPETPPPVFTDDQLRRLLRACEGRYFDDRRDMAIVRLLLDTGMRRSECVNLTVEDVDLDANVANVVGKGRRPRACPFGYRTAQAIDRYLRSRAAHRLAHLPELWLGRAEPLGESGMRDAVRTRAQKAGLDGVHLHLFRHTFAHTWLASGGPENDLMRLAGWRSR